MGSIERIGLVEKSKLSEEFYFASLIEEAYNNSLLNDADIERIQIMCLELLAYKIERYTDGESSSVKTEVAESIYKSNLYTIGLYLKTFSFPDDAVKVLKEKNISELYMHGRKLINTKLKIARQFHGMAMKNILRTDHYAYLSTVVDGIKGFFKIYNADYEAHEIHITVDYPLCNPIENLVGIEFVEKYSESIHYENMFCKYFSPDAIHHLLCGYDERYNDLIFNLFEQVLTCAIGCALSGKDVADLNISAIQFERIKYLFSGKSKEEIEAVLLNSYHRLVNKLTITSLPLQKYMEKTLRTITLNIYSAMETDKLERVFFSPKYPELNPHIHFSFGDKMDNKKYSHIIDEIIQCRYTSDKIAIIKGEIKSLADLEDLFFDAKLTANEINVVLEELDVTEIAALAKRHPNNAEIEEVDLSHEEIAFRLCLNKYILSLPQEKQNLIAKTIGMINNDIE